MEPEDLEAIDNKLAMNYTKQRAYRDICEWATAHKVMDNETVKVMECHG